MSFSHSFLYLHLFIFFTGCSMISTISVHYDYDPDVDFGKLKSYKWLPIPREAEINQLNVERVVNAVNQQLDTKGFTMASGNPDFLIAAHVGKTEKLDVRSWGYGQGLYGKPRGERVSQYEQGTLVLDFIDAQTKEIIWRGAAKGAIDPDPTPEKREKRINEAVRKILEKFPPQPR